MRPLLLTFCLLAGAVWPASAALAASTSTVTVQKGQTLFGIARKHQVSVGHLQALNGLSGDQIRVGQVLRLTGTAARPQRQTVGQPNARKPRAGSINATVQGIYTVKKGDTLGHIARSHHVSVRAVQRANAMSGTTIHTGEALRIPAVGQAASPVTPRTIPALPPGMEARRVYTYATVRPGQTPSSFAARFGTTPARIRQLNGLNTGQAIVPGKRLLVPRTMALPVPPNPARRAISFRRVTVRGATVQVVRVDLRHRDVLVAPVLPGQSDFDRGATVSALTRISGAQAVVNGSYFHPRSYAPAGDIVKGGRLLTWGRLPVALAITPDNRAVIVGGASMGAGRATDSSWDGMETVVSSGPLIVSGGAVQTSYSRVFHDPAVFGRAARSAIGLLSSRDLILVSTHDRLSVGEMARVMVSLGARDALLLDGGSSAGISYKGQTMLNSVRKVSYGIGVFTGYKGPRYSR